MIKQFLAKRRTRKFILSMSQTLTKDYGASQEYTEGQVKTALKKLGYGEEFTEISIGIFCNEDIAKAFGINDALIKKYRGYPKEHNIGIGTDGYTGESGMGGSSD